MTDLKRAYDAHRITVLAETLMADSTVVAELARRARARGAERIAVDLLALRERLRGLAGQFEEVVRKRRRRTR